MHSRAAVCGTVLDETGPRSRRAADARPPSTGRSRLHVAVRQESGAPVLEGRIECHWAESPHVEGDPFYRTQEVKIDGPTTTIELPSWALGALVVASPKSGLPGKARLDNLRNQNDRWHAEGETVDWDVEVIVDSGLTSVLEGSVTVDGEERIPDGLTVFLIQDPLDQPREATSMEEFYATSPQIGWVDHERATYRVWPVAPKARKLRVGSRETKPRTIELSTFEPSGGVRRLDLHLETGGRLELTVVDREGSPVAGLPIEFTHEYLLRSTFTRQHYDRHRVTTQTDSDGRAILSGLTPKGFVRAYAPSRQLGRELWSGRVPSDLDGTLHAQAEYRTDDVPSLVWGRLSDLRAVAESLSPEVHVVALGAPGVAAPFPVARDEEQGTWSCAVPAGDYAVWLQSDEGRASGTEFASVEAGGEAALELLALPRRLLALRWLNAPEGATLEWRGRAEHGPLEASRQIALDEPHGETLVNVAALQALDVEAHVGERLLVRRRLTGSFDDPIEVDFAALADVDFHLFLNGKSPGGAGSLTVVPLGTARSSSVATYHETAQAGRARIAIPADAKELLYLYSDAQETAFICGVTTLVAPLSDEAARASVRHCIGWQGGLYSAKQLLPSEDDWMELVAIGDTDVTSLFGKKMRTIRAQDLTAPPGEGAEILVDLKNCSWVLSKNF
ncbi:MAG: hypothetical protein AAF682_20545 [Planctomycetota bacterium]